MPATTTPLTKILGALGLLAAALALFTSCSNGDSVAEAAVEKDWVSLIDEERAFTDLKNYVELGPASHKRGNNDRLKKGRVFIKEGLRAAGIEDTRRQEWPQDITVGDAPRKVLMENIIGVLPGKRKDAVAIACHYDIKILPRFVGANDGGSGVALTLELARQLVKRAKGGWKPEFSYYFVFFDGEEAFVDWNEVGTDGHKDNTYGSRYLAERLDEYPIKALVLLDLVADAKLDITVDTSSTRALSEMFVETGREVFGISKFGDAKDILDDHHPFMTKGVPAIDLIDFNYGTNNSYWHSPKDLVEHCSARSLAYVGTLVLSALPKLSAWLLAR
ncbi:MAG: M28 family metallopeptidase [Planctomycetota bacterium]